MIILLTIVSMLSFNSFAVDSKVEGEGIPPVTCKEDSRVTLRGGTMIPIETSSIISSKNAVVGEKINLKTTYAVRAGGETVIPPGSSVQGKIVSVTKRKSVGKPGEVTIKAESVQAIDGTFIPLHSQPITIKGEDKKKMAWGLTVGGCVLGIWVLIGIFSPLFLLIKGGEAIIPANTSVNATTVNDVDIEVN